MGMKATMPSIGQLMEVMLGPEISSGLAARKFIGNVQNGPAPQKRRVGERPPVDPLKKKFLSP